MDALLTTRVCGFSTSLRSCVTGVQYLGVSITLICSLASSWLVSSSSILRWRVGFWKLACVILWNSWAWCAWVGVGWRCLL
ncbi:hypothetical protein BDU57DRAFT_508849 [Ampelomyces quisqualis]|uniref:Uncharacterized protein n=1 Tax=Ampelomyces quisqualis TaxID=50730 RepID=A0A6A5QXI7_AMPQU|nr:hypothetical protein BDU57DRAFT_508849 [Ampelomyces quisqualis]